MCAAEAPFGDGAIGHDSALPGFFAEGLGQGGVLLVVPGQTLWYWLREAGKAMGKLPAVAADFNEGEPIKDGKNPQQYLQHLAHEDGLIGASCRHDNADRRVLMVSDSEPRVTAKANSVVKK